MMNNETEIRGQANYMCHPDDGTISVKNLSAYWIPELTIQEKIHGTTYIVSGSYEGTGLFTRKLERILAKRLADDVSCAIQVDQPVSVEMLQMKGEKTDDNSAKE